MAGFRATGYRNEVMDSLIMPGDLVLGGESFSSITTAGAGSWTGAAIATGLIRRTGPGGGYTDTVDTSENIINALKGNSPDAEVLPGTTFRLLFINTVAQLMTLSLPNDTGLVTGLGTLTAIANNWREYLFTVVNSSPRRSVSCATTLNSKVVSFVLPTGISAWPMGSRPDAVNLTTGMMVSGTGVTAGTTVASVTQGPGGTIGVVLSANATADGTNVSLSFWPVVKIDALRSGTI